MIAILRAYQSFVLGLVFAVAGAIGLFSSDQSSIRVPALIGVAVGFLVAPFQAFHRLRVERDLARSQAQGQYGVQRLFPQQFVNAISGSSWAVDSFEPVQDAALVMRGIIGAYPLAREYEVESTLLDGFRVAAASSAIDHWLRQRFGDIAVGQEWQIVAPCNGYEFTVERAPFLVGSGGSEIRVRCMLILPRGGMAITAPRVLVDLIARDAPKELPEGALPDANTRLELIGEPFRTSIGGTSARNCSTVRT